MRKLTDLELSTMIIMSMNKHMKLNHYVKDEDIKYHLISGKELVNIISDFINFEVEPKDLK